MQRYGAVPFGRPRSEGRTRPPRRAVAILAIVAAATLTTSACSGGHAQVAGSPASLPTTASALPTVDLHGFRTMLAGAHGTPVLLNVWASWCGPCSSEAPDLARLAKEYAGRVTFVGLDVQDTTTSARAFISKYGWTFPSVADPEGRVRSGLGFVGQPVTVVFDATGKQVFVLSGPITAAQIREALGKVS